MLEFGWVPIGIVVVVLLFLLYSLLISLNMFGLFLIQFSISKRIESVEEVDDGEDDDDEDGEAEEDSNGETPPWSMPVGDDKKRCNSPPTVKERSEAWVP